MRLRYLKYMDLKLSKIQHSGVQKLVEIGINRVKPSKIYFFGSRASGTHRPTSDFDIAFEFSKEQTPAWNQFLFEIEDSAYTLFHIDWIDLNTVRPEFQKNIRESGICIYEAKREL